MHYNHFLLTSKRPLSPWGTNGILGSYIQADFFVMIFETFWKIKKIDYFHGNIILFSIDVQEQK